MHNRKRMESVAFALTELNTKGEVIVTHGEVFHDVTDTLSMLDVDYRFEIHNDTCNRVYLENQTESEKENGK